VSVFWLVVIWKKGETFTQTLLILSFSLWDWDPLKRKICCCEAEERINCKLRCVNLLHHVVTVMIKYVITYLT